MTTSWIARTGVNTTWGISRLGGVYLTDVNGDYILTQAGEKIIISFPGGSIPLNNWNTRTTITTNWSARPSI